MDIKKILIGAGVVVIGYQAWKIISKPKGEPKSNASGKALPLKYNILSGKVMKPSGQGFDAKYITLNDSQQPKAMDWYWLNDRWVWTKWDGKLDYKGKVPTNYLVR